MATPELLGLYPLSSPDGQAIPYEIIRPIGLIRQDFNDVGSAAIPIPAEADIVAFFSNVSCIVRFNNTAEVPENGSNVSNSMFIAANTYINVDHNGASSFSVIGLSAAGTLFTIVVQKWKDIRKTVQYNRP